MVPPLGGPQDPAGPYPPWLVGRPTPIGEGLTAPFNLGFVPGGHGTPPPGRRSITVDDETWLRPYSDCAKVVNVHLCIDPAAAKAGCGDKAQEAVNKTVETMEKAVQRWWSGVFCPCDDPDNAYAPGGCSRRVRIIWHSKCGDAGGGITPLTVNVRCSSREGQPAGLTTPDEQMDVEAPKGRGEMIEEVYAHEIGHNLLGVPPPGGPSEWDGEGHNVNDPEAGAFHPLMAPGLRTGRGRVSRKEACLLVELTGGCDKELCCKPILGVAQVRLRNSHQPASIGRHGKD